MPGTPQQEYREPCPVPNYTGYDPTVTGHSGDLVTEVTVTEIIPSNLVIVLWIHAWLVADLPKNYILIRGLHFTETNKVITFNPGIDRSSKIHLIDPSTWTAIKSITLSTTS